MPQQIPYPCIIAFLSKLAKGEIKAFALSYTLKTEKRTNTFLIDYGLAKDILKASEGATKNIKECMKPI